MHCCSAQTRTGIGLLGKPPSSEAIPTAKSQKAYAPPTRPMRKRSMKRTSVVEHNLYFAGPAIVG